MVSLYLLTALGVLASPVSTEITGPATLSANTTEAELRLSEPRLTNLSWSTNVGSVVRAPQGDTLVYRPDVSTFPRLALIGAYDASTRQPLLHVIRLDARPVIEVDSEPNVEVTVEVAGKRFGPQRTDARGTALLEVEVPPGVQRATTFATDSYGNVTTGQLVLDPPAFSRVLAICAPEDSSVYVAQINTDGSPSESPDFALETGELDAAPPALVQPGLYRVALEATAETPSRSVSVRVTSAGFSSQCSFQPLAMERLASFTLDGTVEPLQPARNWFLGAQLGWLTNGNRISAPWLAARIHRSMLGQRAGLRLGASLGYASSNDTLLTADDQSLELSVQTWPLVANAEYVFDFGVVRPKVTADLGVSITRAEAGGTTVRTDEVFVEPWLGVQLGGEWWYLQHQFDLLLGYAWSNHTDGAIVGNVAGARAVLGYQYNW